MNIKLVSKNTLGIIATLILVILLSQSRCFNFLTETPLGRMFLLAITIIIAYTNKIFGLLAVLFIIIAFNLNDINVVQSYNFYEGFKQKKVKNPAKKLDEVKKVAKGYGVSTNKKSLNDYIDEATEEVDAETFTTTSSSVSGDGREGFCMSDRELNILRGKQSNAVPVFNNLREQNNEVDPSDKSFFSSDYALF